MKIFTMMALVLVSVYAIGSITGVLDTRVQDLTPKTVLVDE